MHNFEQDIHDIYPVPPVAWSAGPKRGLNHAENEKIFRYLVEQGIKRLIYGGNAMVYHMALSQYEELVEWLSGHTADAEIMPAVGPSYGRALDQAVIIRRRRFHSLLVLPSSSDPRDARGLEFGLRDISEAAGLPLTLYIRDESNFGSDGPAGLDVIGRLVDANICTNIKYAVVRKEPADDAYLRALLMRVPASRVISGLGERPAIVHVRDFHLAGFTTGSGVLAPRLCRDLLDACCARNWESAERIRSFFLPLEDLRDAWGPPRVLHYAVAAAGIAETGPILPYVSPLSEQQLRQVTPVASNLYTQNRALSSAQPDMPAQTR
jgi:4-hydroxy-tetrahydrodipicolinate synthase